MKDSVLVNVNVWQLARFCECLDVYRSISAAYNIMPYDMYMDSLTDAVREWKDINEYTNFVIDDVQEMLMRMGRVPHMMDRYRNLIIALESVKEV